LKKYIPPVELMPIRITRQDICDQMEEILLCFFVSWTPIYGTCFWQKCRFGQKDPSHILRWSFAHRSLWLVSRGPSIFGGIGEYCEPGKSDPITKADYIRSIIYFNPEEVRLTVSLPKMRETRSSPACSAGGNSAIIYGEYFRENVFKYCLSMIVGVWHLLSRLLA